MKAEAYPRLLFKRSPADLTFRGYLDILSFRMGQIRFRSESENERAFVKEVRQRVRAYFQNTNTSFNGNLRMHVKTVVVLCLYIIPFVAVLTIPMQPLIALGIAVLIGIGEAGVGMSVMHDAVHGAYSGKKWVNKLLGSSMFLLGSNTFNWKIQHNIRHHTYTNVYNHDPDISTKVVIRLSEHAPLEKYHRYQHIYAFLLYGFMTLARLFGDLFVLFGYNKEGTTKAQKANPTAELIKLAATKIIYFGILFGLPLVLTDFTFWQVLLGFSVMHITAGMIMSSVFQMAHVVEGTYQPLPDKENSIHCDWVVHEMKSTSDFGRNNGLLSWYIGGLDYQIEHHLFPYICHVHYPSIAPIVEGTAREFGIPYNLKPSFGHALISHINRLKELGRKPVAAPAA